MEQRRSPHTSPTTSISIIFLIFEVRKLSDSVFTLTKELKPTNSIQLLFPGQPSLKLEVALKCLFLTCGHTQVIWFL